MRFAFFHALAGDDSSENSGPPAIRLAESVKLDQRGSSGACRIASDRFRTARAASAAVGAMSEPHEREDASREIARRRGDDEQHDSELQPVCHRRPPTETAASNRRSPDRILARFHYLGPTNSTMFPSGSWASRMNVAGSRPGMAVGPLPIGLIPALVRRATAASTLFTLSVR